MECHPQGVYRPRNAQETRLYHLVEDHFDELERVWDERYEREYGFWRPVTRRVVEQFLDCGDLRCGDGEASPARIFPALDFLAALCTHIPDAGQQLVRYSGAFSNVRRARVRAAAGAGGQPARMQAQNDDDSGCADAFADRRRSSWARLIKKVYEAAPLVCPRCSGKLEIVCLIGDNAVIEKILRHLKLWDRPERPPPPPPDRSNHYDPDIAGWEQADPA